jgi:hypothetical protein
MAHKRKGAVVEHAGAAPELAMQARLAKRGAHGRGGRRKKR